MRKYLGDVRIQRDKQIMSHFRDNHDDRDLWFSVLENTVQCQSYGTVTQRGIWVKRLKTERPKGCNVKDVVLSFQLRR